MYKITKGIPLPTRSNNHLYPFGDMEVGDSFEVEAGKKDTVSGASLHYAAKNKGKKFSTRKMPDGSYRCWRVS